MTTRYGDPQIATARCQLHPCCDDLVGHPAGRRLRGFLRLLDDAELSGCSTAGSWFTAGLHPDGDGMFPLAQGGSQRLWDTAESCYAVWRRLGEPNVEQFGVTAYHDAALQYVWFDHPDSHYR
jgi:hypothetical protein